MLASVKMARWLLLAVALLVLSLASSCGSSSDTATEGQDAVTEAMGAATKVVDQQERAIARAWAMAQVAIAWHSVDPVAAQQAIDDAVEAAKEAADGGDGQRSAAAKLREQSADWQPTEWRSAIALAERIERNSSRAWVLRAIAGELMDQDPDQASSLLADALEIAARNPLPQYRSADTATAAVELSRIDHVHSVQALVSPIEPAAKARALREMAGQFAETDPELVDSVLADALSAAREIGDPYDRAWALRESAVLPGMDVAQAQQLLGEAEEAAAQIEDVEPQAFARSDIAAAWATLDPDEAMAVVERIAPNYPEARVAALVGIAEARFLASDPEGAESALDKAVEENERVLDTYEQARAVNAIVSDIAALDHERAVTLAREIDDSYFRAEALRSLAVAVAGEKADHALSLAEAIQPRFIRVQALVAVGEKVAAVDEEKAVSIFEQALSEAGELKDTYPLRLLASAWAPLDPVKALEIAEKVEDDGDRVHALTDVALSMLATDPAKAQVTFETARDTAQGMKSDEDPFLAAGVLRDMASAWLAVDEAEAGRLYDAAFEAAAAVAVEATG